MRWRPLLTVALLALLLFSAYGTSVPGTVRCGLPGAVGCPGGILGPTVSPASAGEQWFTVTMYDWGFWIADSTTGANETQAWNVFEGWTVHVNATSLPPDAAIGGTAYHGLGVEVNATGQQLMSLAAPVGQWTQGAFIAPSAEYHHQHIWCTISCGPGHGSQQAWVLNVIPALPLPHAVATSNVTTGAAPLLVSFNGTATQGTSPYNVSWDFGDGSPLTYADSATHSYALGGDYTARFQVTDSKGMTAVASISIGVNSTSPLQARASATVLSGVAPLSTVFRVVGHGGVPPYNFTWEFGDGGSQTGTNLTPHLFLSPGVYAVVASVRDSAGTTTRALASVTVLPAVGSFPITARVSPSNGSPPFATTFSVTPGGGTSPYTYLWVYGDGSTATSANVSHQYNQTGSYAATVFVRDAVGRVGETTLLIPVQASNGGGGGDGNDSIATAQRAAGGLTVLPLVSPNGGGAPLLVNASASIVGGSGANESVTWTFGDGTTATGQVVSHSFAAVGTYVVSVTATDGAGNSGSNATGVRVEAPGMTIQVNASAGDDPFTVGAAVTMLGGSGTYRPVTWTWGDGSSSTGNLVNHSYGPSFTGLVTVRASASDSTGVPLNASTTIRVYPHLSAMLSAVLPASRSAPVDVRLVLAVSGGSGAYAAAPFWNFGDGSSSRGASPIAHAFTKVGDFHVVVQTNDSLGTPVTATVWVNLSTTGGSQGGPPPWSLTGVSDPNRVALILIGLVAASGLVMLRRRQAKRRSPPSPPAGRPTPTPPRSAAGPAPGDGAP